MRSLVKHDCLQCSGQFLVEATETVERSLMCPFCGGLTGIVSSSDPEDEEIWGVLDGCLWPSRPQERSKLIDLIQSAPNDRNRFVVHD